MIVLGSADKYNRYAGAEFGAVWMDEPSHYGDDLHELTGMITTRLRGVEGPKTQVWTLTGEGSNEYPTHRQTSSSCFISETDSPAEAYRTEPVFTDKATISAECSLTV